MSKADFVNEIYQAAIGLGMSDTVARVAATQAALETNYGQSAPGNNYFGIKGKGQTLATKEASNGALAAINSNFKTYASPDASLQDWYKQIQRNWPEVLTAPTYAQAIDALNNGRLGSYATDKVEANDPLTYQDKLSSINQQFLGGTPIPPMNVPDVGAALSISPSPVTSFGGRLGGAALNGIDRLRADGLPTPLPTDFTSDPTGNLDPRLGSMLIPQQPSVDPIGTGAGSFSDLQAMLPPPMPIPRPPTPVAAPPVPVPRPLALSAPQGAPAAPAPSTSTVRLPNGQMIAPGIYPSSNPGNSFTVTAGPNGEAIVTPTRAGFLNTAKMGPGTVAGGVIGNAIAAAAPQVQQQATAALDNLGNQANQAKDQAAAAIEAAKSGLFSGIGGLFNAKSPPVPPLNIPTPPDSQPALWGGGAPVVTSPQTINVGDNGTQRPVQQAGSVQMPAGIRPNVPQISAPVIENIGPKLPIGGPGTFPSAGLPPAPVSAPTMILNPAYAAWQSQYGAPSSTQSSLPTEVTSHLPPGLGLGAGPLASVAGVGASIPPPPPQFIPSPGVRKIAPTVATMSSATPAAPPIISPLTAYQQSPAGSNPAVHAALMAQQNKSNGAKSSGSAWLDSFNPNIWGT